MYPAFHIATAHCSLISGVQLPCVTICHCLPGIHYVGQLEERSLTRFFVDQFTEGQLQWAKMPSVFDAVILGEPGNSKTYHLYGGKKEYVEGLKKQFPNEAAAIEKFMGLVTVILALSLLLLSLLPLPH